MPGSAVRRFVASGAMIGWALWGLIAALVFLAFGGLYGGIAMLSDPSGAALGMGTVLPLLPVADFTLPGVFLLLVMGVAPLLAAFGLLVRPRWAWADSVERLSRHSWAWTAALTLGLVLTVWLVIQGAWIGFRWPIQYVTAVNAALIVALALVPSVRQACRRGVVRDPSSGRSRRRA